MRWIAITLLFTGLNMHAAETTLPLSVQNALNTRNVPHNSLSISVVDVDSGESILEWLPQQSRNPASTIKLLTTLVGLDVLGPAYRWRTDIYARGEIVDGRLDGDLAIKGYGDPFLVKERIWQLVQEIRGAGVTHIDGDLLLDDSWFSVGAYDPGAFDRQPLRAYNVAPNALMMNLKVVRYWFENDRANGSVKVRMEPPLENITLDNRLRIGNSSCRGFQRGITITMSESLDEATFTGRFPSGCDVYTMSRTALSHNEFVFGLFSQMWRQSGGGFDGTYRKVVLTEDEDALLSFKSLPLLEIIARINKHSNNVMARQLLYTLAAESSGPPGTEANGKAVISEWLSSNGLASENTRIENGAGLSRQTRTTTSDMTTILSFAWRQPYMPEFLASMSLAGLDGTLRRRFDDSALVGQAHLKTGSLDHVTAISGYLQSRSGRRFAIAAMQNHPDIHRGPGEEAQEALLRWLFEQ